jgi:hypothetical protein
VIADYNVDNGYRVQEGTSHAAFLGVPKNYGLKSEAIGKDLGKLKEGLAAGGLAIASMNPGHFTSGGHIIVIRGMTDDGKILVADPNDKQPGSPDYQRKSRTQWESSIVLSETNGFWMISK